MGQSHHPAQSNSPWGFSSGFASWPHQARQPGFFKTLGGLQAWRPPGASPGSHTSWFVGEPPAPEYSQGGHGSRGLLLAPPGGQQLPFVPRRSSLSGKGGLP